MSFVMGFQNALASNDKISNACSTVTSVNSIAIRREVKSGSKITVRPASLANASKTTLESLIIFKLTGARDSGFNSGGPAISLGSSAVEVTGEGFATTS